MPGREAVRAQVRDPDARRPVLARAGHSRWSRDGGSGSLCVVDGVE